VNESEELRYGSLGIGKTGLKKRWFQMFTKCCETFTRTDVWWETIPDGRSSSTESASAKWQVTSCNRQQVGWGGS